MQEVNPIAAKLLAGNIVTYELWKEDDTGNVTPLDIWMQKVSKDEYLLVVTNYVRGKAPEEKGYLCSWKELLKEITWHSTLAKRNTLKW